jgi:hypothetical protein
MGTYVSGHTCVELQIFHEYVYASFIEHVRGLWPASSPLVELVEVDGAVGRGGGEVLTARRELHVQDSLLFSCRMW